VTLLTAWALGVLSLAVILHIDAWLHRYRHRRRIERIQAANYRTVALRWLEESVAKYPDDIPRGGRP